MTLLDFLKKNEHRDGDVGKFIRSSILVAELAEFADRDEVKNSASWDLLLDCFMPEQPTNAAAINEALSELDCESEHRL